MSDDDKTRLTPDEARARFGELLHQPTRTYMFFNEPTGGTWVPRFNIDMSLLEYRLLRPVRTKKARPPYQPKGK